MAEHPRVSIVKGREWHLLRGHPWLFSGGISQAPGKVAPGSIVTVLDCDGKFVATGYYNPGCDIAVRILSRTAGEEIDEDFLVRRLRLAWELRRQALDLGKTNVFRLVNAEGDLLPGFIVDYYDGVVVVQCHTAGADALLPVFCRALALVVNAKAIVVRNDSAVRLREGLALEEPRLALGTLEGDLIVLENGYSFAVDPVSGQKTGFFTDQRDKRAALAAFVSRLPPGAAFLNCFSYTCSFSVYAVAEGRELTTTNVDQSQAALAEGRKNFRLNGLPEEGQQFVNAEAFAFLDRQVACGTTYDIAVLDPPAFAKSQKDKVKALKAYARLAGLGMRVLKTGGILAAASCSGAVSLADFSESLKIAAGETGRCLQIINTFQHGVDHPVNLSVSETAYLKVIFCRLLD